MCGECRKPYQPAKSLLDELSLGAQIDHWQLFKGAGCPKCNFTGYSGRLMVGELWTPTQDDVMLIAKEAPMDELVASSASSTFTMAQCASDLLTEGLTNLEELVRVMPFDAIRQMAHLQAAAAMAG